MQRAIQRGIEWLGDSISTVGTAHRILRKRNRRRDLAAGDGDRDRVASFCPALQWSGVSRAETMRRHVIEAPVAEQKWTRQFADDAPEECRARLIPRPDATRVDLSLRAAPVRRNLAAFHHCDFLLAALEHCQSSRSAVRRRVPPRIPVSPCGVASCWPRDASPHDVDRYRCHHIVAAFRLRRGGGAFFAPSARSPCCAPSGSSACWNMTAGFFAGMKRSFLPSPTSLFSFLS